MAGYFGPPGAHDVSLCPAGSFCPADSVNPSPCPSNTVSPAGATAVVNCIPVRGNFGPPGAAAAPCRANFFCPPGAEAETPCPTNTESPGATLDCCPTSLPYFVYFTIPRSPATFRLTQTIMVRAAAGSWICRAAPGFYGPDGTVAAECPRGTYCPAGSPDEFLCPANTESKSRAALLTDCVAIAGFFGPLGAPAFQCPLVITLSFFLFLLFLTPA